jgi:hypothetical protein
MIETVFIGQGTYGVVTSVCTAPRPPFALKWIRTWRPHVCELDRLGNEDENIIASETEAVDELLIFYLLSKLEAPGFARYYGAVYIRDPEDVTKKHTHTQYLCIAHRLGQKESFVKVLWDFQPNVFGTRHLVFSLLFSLVVAQIRLGFQHRDITMKNIVLDTLPGAASVDRFVVGDTTWDLSLETCQDPGIPFFIDFGFSTFVDAPSRRHRPHIESDSLASHSPPELYFTDEPDGTPLEPRDEHADIFQLGLVFATILGLTSLGNEEREEIFGVEPPRGDLVEDLFNNRSDFKRLCDNFINVLVIDVLPKEVSSNRERKEWKQRFLDTNDDNGRKFHRLLGILCLLKALGLGYLPTYAPFHSSTFYRFMTHRKMVDFMADRIAPSLLQAQFSRVVERIRIIHGQPALDLLRQMMQWEPSKRVLRSHEAHTLLTMQYFLTMRQLNPGRAMADRMYRIEARPTLTATNCPVVTADVWKDCQEVRNRVDASDSFARLQDAMPSLLEQRCKFE